MRQQFPEEKILVTGAEVLALLSIGKTTLYRMMAAGTLPKPVRIGAAVRWRMRDLLECVDRMEAAGAGPDGGQSAAAVTPARAVRGVRQRAGHRASPTTTA